MNDKILLIEDDDLIRDLYKSELDAAGFLTTACANGQSGLEALTKDTFNLVLLDIMLPDTNGLEILKKIKNDPKTHKTPVVLLTNLGQDSVIKEGFNLGAVGYLIKLAYNPDQIIQEVKNILKQKF